MIYIGEKCDRCGETSAFLVGGFGLPDGVEVCGDCLRHHQTLEAAAKPLQEKDNG